MRAARVYTDEEKLRNLRNIEQIADELIVAARTMAEGLPEEVSLGALVTALISDAQSFAMSRDDFIDYVVGTWDHLAKSHN